MAHHPSSEAIKALIRTVPDFPKSGIQFRDITTLLLDPKGFQLCVDAFADRYRSMKIDVIAGVESRGFIIGAPLALALGLPFVPLRKPGKLPAKTVRYSYQLEYGSDTLEMHEDAVSRGQRVLVIDDLIATGGTMEAACRLIETVGAEVAECACVVELPDLKGRDKLGSRPLYVLVEFEGD
eukprot:TRINITY_DN400_c0_g1_i1.p1 TRINITY_DN400_c0_g1~~TRINITY_DN400_c0_g1_i1.p1  ORF type:complete len:197 (+),score=76.12 TRINITY_DN400_c0_g1_i1:51-593(+)